MKFIFVTGMGRSGTKFLAKLLENAPNTAVTHEGIGDREFWLLSWYLGEDYSIPYLERERGRIETEYSNSAAIYIDVNGYLQHAVSALRSVFPTGTIHHLVRDPRRVVPSLCARRGDRRVHVIPKEAQLIDWWIRASKFEQVCWNWSETVRRLQSEGVLLLKFEEILKDYDYVQKRLLFPHGLALSRETWERHQNVKVNRTQPRFIRRLYSLKKANFGKVTEMVSAGNWTELQRSQFDDICGEVAESVGYQR